MDRQAPGVTAQACPHESPGPTQHPRRPCLISLPRGNGHGGLGKENWPAQAGNTNVEHLLTVPDTGDKLLRRHLFILLSRKEKLGKLPLAQGLQKRLKGHRGGGAGGGPSGAGGSRTQFPRGSQTAHPRLNRRLAPPHSSPRRGPRAAPSCRKAGHLSTHCSHPVAPARAPDLPAPPQIPSRPSSSPSARVSGPLEILGLAPLAWHLLPTLISS